MKKSKLTLNLVTTFIATLGMSSCSDVTKNADAMVTFTGYDGQEIAVISNDLYHDYINSSSGIQTFYEAMLEVLIRYEYEDSNSVLRQLSAQYEESGDEDKQISSVSTIKSQAKEKLEGYKKEAKNNADENDTDYSDEWETILTDNGVESEEEFLQKIIYDLEKEEIEDWYYNVNADDLLAEYLGVDAEGNSLTDSDQLVASRYPYHIRHILTSLDSGDDEYTQATITESEASSLGNVTRALYEGKLSFGTIAKQFSGDSSSAELGGSVGIMDTDTSFVNEFKLGIYAYDAVYSTNDDDNIDAGLGLTGDYDVDGDGEVTEGETVESKLEAIGLSYVPYEAFTYIAANYDVDRDSQGRTVNDDNSAYYPRNVYYNKYINHHNVFVITNNAIDATTQADFEGTITADSAINSSYQEAAEGSCGFRYVEGISQSADQMILTDEQGNPIICVRSEHGIHFMIIEKSIYEADVSDYYSTLTPDDDGYDANADNYVNYVGGNDKSVYKERAEAIEDLIKGFDSTYDYRLYEYFLEAEGGRVSFHTDEEAGIDIAESVEKYIASQRLYNNWDNDNTINDTWNEYLELLDYQEAERSSTYVVNGTTQSRLISEMCALHYSNGSDDELYKEGGACYYYDK